MFAEVEPMAIMVENMQQAGRHGAKAVAESLLLIYKQEAERDRKTDTDWACWLL